MESILIFGGKGGVGKSSISTATAVYLANQLQAEVQSQKRILLVSFDIAHNLSDLFNREVGNDVIQITENLFAIEPDPDLYTESYTQELTKKTRLLLQSSKVLAMFPQLESVIEESLKGENLPLAMKNALFFQSILDAENPLEEIGERHLKYIGLGQTKDTPIEKRKGLPPFDIMICDFPPTGNMLALFEVPADPSRRLMKLALKILSAFQESFNKLKSLTKWAQPAVWMAKRMIKSESDPENPLETEEQHNLAQEILDLLFEMEKRSDRIAKLLKNIGSLRLVSIPEKPSVEEAKRAWEMSRPFVSVDAIHVNRLIPLSEQGNSKYLDKILETQQKYKEKIHSDFATIKIWDSDLLEDEPIGLLGLRRLAKEVYHDSPISEILNPLKRQYHVPDRDTSENPIKLDEIKQKWHNS